MGAMEQLLAERVRQENELVRQAVLEGGRQQPPWDKESQRLHQTAVERLTRMAREADTTEERNQWDRCLALVQISEEF